MRAFSSDTSRRQKWEEERNYSIGASEAASVLDRNPWQSKYALYAEKSGLVEPEKITDDDEERFWIAHQHERTLGDWFTRKTGAIITDVGEFTIQRHPHNSFMTATLDRVVTLPYVARIKGIPEKYAGKIGIAEMKASNLRDMWADDEEIPEHVWIQVQHQMSVTQYEFAVVIALIGAYTPKWFFVERDNEFIQDLEVAEGKFWADVIGHRMPEVDGSESASNALKRLRIRNADLLVGDMECLDKHRERVMLKAQLDAAEEKKSELDNWFKARIGENKGLWFTDPETGKKVQYTFTETTRDPVITVDAGLADKLRAAGIDFELKEGTTSRRFNPPRQAKG